mgnify:CR=1 FL=1
MGITRVGRYFKLLVVKMEMSWHSLVHPNCFTLLLAVFLKIKWMKLINRLN